MLDNMFALDRRLGEARQSLVGLRGSNNVVNEEFQATTCQQEEGEEGEWGWWCGGFCVAKSFASHSAIDPALSPIWSADPSQLQYDGLLIFWLYLFIQSTSINTEMLWYSTETEGKGNLRDELDLVINDEIK